MFHGIQLINKHPAALPGSKFLFAVAPVAAPRGSPANVHHPTGMFYL